MPTDSALPGMSSTPSIMSMSDSWSVGAHRREPDAAVAEHDGGDAVGGRGLEGVVPGDLAVVVGVQVEEAGGDDGAVGVDDLACRVADGADGDDASRRGRRCRR